MEKQTLLYEGKAKRVYATQNPELLIVSYKDDATAYLPRREPGVIRQLDNLHQPPVRGQAGQGQPRLFQPLPVVVRENKVPFLGICLGMQLAVVEFARNVCGLAGAHSAELDPQTPLPSPPRPPKPPGTKIP